jgi:hypothetical protein
MQGSLQKGDRGKNPKHNPTKDRSKKEPPQQHNARYKQTTLLDLARPPTESHTPTFSAHALRLRNFSLSHIHL